MKLFLELDAETQERVIDKLDTGLPLFPTRDAIRKLISTSYYMIDDNLNVIACSNTVLTNE